jgi:hypothetical protein
MSHFASSTAVGMKVPTLPRRGTRRSVFVVCSARLCSRQNSMKNGVLMWGGLATRPQRNRDFSTLSPGPRLTLCQGRQTTKGDGPSHFRMDAGRFLRVRPLADQGANRPVRAQKAVTAPAQTTAPSTAPAGPHGRVPAAAFHPPATLRYRSKYRRPWRLPH